MIASQVMSAQCAHRLTLIIRSASICRQHRKWISLILSTSRCLLGCSAKCVRCSGTGGQQTVVFLLGTMAATRTSYRQMVIGSEINLLGGQTVEVAAKGQLAQTVTLVVESSSGIVQISLCWRLAAHPQRPPQRTQLHHPQLRQLHHPQRPPQRPQRPQRPQQPLLQYQFALHQLPPLRDQHFHQFQFAPRPQLQFQLKPQ